MGDGPEPIADKAQLHLVRRGARTLLTASTISGLLATALFLIPG